MERKARSRQTLLHIAALVLCGTLSACVSSGQPQRLLATDEGCRAIAGTFASDSDKTDTGYTPRLPGILFAAGDDPYDSEVAREADRVELSWESESVLRVRAMRGAEEIVTRRLSRTDGALQCRQGALRISTYAGGTRGQGNPVAGLETSATFLLAGADGSLVVKRTTETAGLIYLMIPIALGDTQWRRFPRVTRP